jgi:hypothetical protein
MNLAFSSSADLSKKANSQAQAFCKSQRLCYNKVMISTHRVRWGRFISTFGMLLLCAVLFGLLFGTIERRDEVGFGLVIQEQASSWSEKFMWYFTTEKIMEIVVAISCIVIGKQLIEKKTK